MPQGILQEKLQQQTRIPSWQGGSRQQGNVCCNAVSLQLQNIQEAVQDMVPVHQRINLHCLPGS